MKINKYNVILDVRLVLFLLFTFGAIMFSAYVAAQLKVISFTVMMIISMATKGTLDLFLGQLLVSLSFVQKLPLHHFPGGRGDGRLHVTSPRSFKKYLNNAA